MKLFFERVIFIQKANILYSYIVTELETSPKISNITKKIRSDESLHKIASNYDISQLRTIVKLVKSGINEDAINIIMFPVKNVKVMAKMGEAVNNNVPLDLLSVVANYPNGKGIALKQSLILDILSQDSSLFDISDMQKLITLSDARLNTIKSAVNVGISKENVLNIVHCSIDDEQLSKISSNLMADTDERVLSTLLNNDYTPKQLDALVNLMNSFDNNMQDYFEILFNNNNSAELIESIIKSVKLYSKDSEKLNQVVKRLLESDPNKVRGVFNSLLYGLDESTLKLYYDNSIDSDTMNQLLFAKINGVSDRNIRRLMEFKDLSSRRKMRLEAEGKRKGNEPKKTISFDRFIKPPAAKSNLQQLNQKTTHRSLK